VNASKIGIGILYAMPVISAASLVLTGKFPLGKLPPEFSRGEGVAVAAGNVGGIYIGSHLWKSHPFWGGLIGTLAGGMVIAFILSASHKNSPLAAKTTAANYDTDEQGV
jgi:hypothetical protein